jgi:hypothetical protein
MGPTLLEEEDFLLPEPELESELEPELEPEPLEFEEGVNAVSVSYSRTTQSIKDRPHTKSRRQSLITKFRNHIPTLIILPHHLWGNIIRRCRIIMINPLHRAHIKHPNPIGPRILLYAQGLQGGRQTAADRNHLAIPDDGAGVAGAANGGGAVRFEPAEGGEGENVDVEVAWVVGGVEVEGAVCGAAVDESALSVSRWFLFWDRTLREGKGACIQFKRIPIRAHRADGTKLAPRRRHIARRRLRVPSLRARLIKTNRAHIHHAVALLVKTRLRRRSFSANHNHKPLPSAKIRRVQHPSLRPILVLSWQSGRGIRPALRAQIPHHQARKHSHVRDGVGLEHVAAEVVIVFRGEGVRGGEGAGGIRG